MEVILLERVEKLGQMGDVVTVKPGYARNFLLPQKKAMRATKTNMEQFEGQRAQLEATNLERRKDAEDGAGKMEGLNLVMIRSAGESGQLYGSVTSRDVAESLAEQGVQIERRQVELASPIKMLGIHAARVRLHPEVAVEVTLNVAQSEDEAAAQAARGNVGTAGGDETEAAETSEPAIEATEISEEAAEAFFEEPETVTGGEEEGEDGAAGEDAPGAPDEAEPERTD